VAAQDFDLTELKVGKLGLDRSPDTVFAEVERSISLSAHFVPGIGPSPDRTTPSDAIDNFRKADPDCGSRPEAALKERRSR
jgi:hypothetical protein